MANYVIALERPDGTYYFQDTTIRIHPTEWCTRWWTPNIRKAELFTPEQISGIKDWAHFHDLDVEVKEVV